MNGAEALLRTLVAAGVDTCFANPGTSEMHFVAALDRVDGMRSVLALAEGVASGAADGYGRIAGKPAATLLHCGPGLANGIANLHNARRARSPIVNLIGDLAHHHRAADPPLRSETENIARTVSAWTRTALDAYSVASDGACAIAAASSSGGAIASLILPSDVCWTEGAQVATPKSASPPARASEAAVKLAAEWVRQGATSVLLIGHGALHGLSLLIAGAIAARTGVRLMTESSIPRIERGQGRPDVQRIPYSPGAAVDALAGARKLVLVGASRPVFSFPGLDGRSGPLREDVEVAVLASAEEDIRDALERLADCIGWKHDHQAYHRTRPSPSLGDIGPQEVARSIAALMPEQCIVVDEGVTFGRNVYSEVASAQAHDWLQLTGGAIGSGMPMATGAAVAAPGRRVINLQVDGSALYTLQALWTQARERLDVTTVIFSNRSYAILSVEMARLNAVSGDKSNALLRLDDPPIDWTYLAKGFGVEAARACTMKDFNHLFDRSTRMPGPFLIELMIAD